ncbi:MAG: ABC transporter ATP-binding protein [Synechococcales cyanobacterium]
MLRAEDLAGGYGSRPVVSGITLSISAGEWLSVVGGNGSGKSTLVRLLSRLLKPSHGQVCFQGRDLQTWDPQALSRQMAVLPQQPRIPVGLTVRQLVSLGRSPHQPWWRWQVSGAGQARVQWALEQVDLLGYAHRWVEELSGGERQRAFLALALAQDPQVLLLDEPTTFLDLRYQLELLEVLRRLHQQGLTVITVLHDLNLAARYSQRMALMHQGSLVDVGSPEAMLTPETLRQVFGLECERLQTPVGLQICPMSSVGGIPQTVVCP